MTIYSLFELLLLASLWGGSFLFMRIAAPVFGPICLTEIRLLVAGLALFPLLIRLNLLNQLRRNFIPLLVLGTLNSAIPYLLFAFAALFLPAGFTSILNATTPLFGTVIAFFWMQEKLTLNRILGLILGFIGVVVLVGWTNLPITPSFILAVSGGLLGALMYAIGGFYTKQKLSKISPLIITTGSLLSAAIVLLPLMPFTVPTELPSMEAIVVVLALALFSTSLAYLLYFRLIKNIGATKTLTVAYLIPLFAMIWGTIILGEDITKSMIVGCSLILFGTAIALF
jgi:drug/metabolite transporter (DMT)-like permease